MTRFTCLALLLAVLAISTQAQNATKATDAYNTGLELQERGDIAGALVSYDRAIQLDPKMADAYNNRANLRMAGGDRPGAIADLSRVIELSPGHSLGFYDRGNAYLESEDYDLAIADYTKAITILEGITTTYSKRAHAMSYNNRGNAYLSKGDARSASADYARSLQVQPNNFEALLNGGLAFQQLGDNKAAIESYSKALNVMPDSDIVLINRAGASEEIDPAASIADYTRVIELKPDNATAFARRGLVLLGKGEKAKAAADLEKAFRMQPDLKQQFGVYLKQALGK